MNLIKFNTKYNSRKKFFETTLNLDGKLLTEQYLNDILVEYFNQLNETTHISIITKVETTDLEVYTLGNKHVIEFTNKNDINNYINTVLSKFNEHFHTSQHYDPLFIGKVTICHSNASLNSYTNFNRKINRHNSLLLNNQISKGIIDKYKTPFNIMYQSWGDIEHLSASSIKITNNDFNSNIDYIIVNNIGSFKSTKNSLILFFKDGKIVNLIDKMQEDGYIKRIYNDSNGKTDFWYTFNPILSTPDLFVNYNKLPKMHSKDKDGNEDLNKRTHIIKKVLNYDDIERKVWSLQNKFPDSNIPDFQTPKFKGITLDCEAYLNTTLDNKGNEIENFNLFSLCFYDGSNVFKFYISDFNSINEMLDACFDKIFVKHYSGYTIYIHNGARFDLVFLLNYLLNRNDITIGNDVIYKDGKFIQIIMSKKMKENGKTFTLKFKINDSYLILNNSLSSLGKSFNVKTQKDIFPHSFVNSDNLNYVGPVPAFEYFNSNTVSNTEYYEYKERFNNLWSLKSVVLDYCSKDCISLYQIISQFKSLIDNKFKIDIQQCPTLTSIAFKIFKANYYDIDNAAIPLLTREIYDDLHNAFHGGHVDMYIPEGPSGNGSLNNIITKFNSLDDKSPENIRDNFNIINHYDVNSLYPSQMISNKYPTDMICEFIGDITTNNETKNLYENFVGVYKVHMFAPDIEHPIIPIKIKGTTIFGKGDFVGWYYSEELKNSEKYGYKFKILGGYVFESKNVFENYINDLYQIKQNSAKGTAMYLISKLLMNSLFGRFGLNTFLPTAQFLSNEEFDNKIAEKKIDSIEVLTKDFENHVLVVTPNKSKEFSNSDGNIAVSLAITANSRIIMSEVKNNKDIKLLYTDTDSAFIEGSLPNNKVDPKRLGYWSLENQYLYSIFLSPKTYACLDINGNVYSKVKGYDGSISIEEFSNLLQKDVIRNPLTQKKWQSFITSSKLIIKTTTYDLVATENKRNLTYNTENRLCGTTSKTINFVENKNIVLTPPLSHNSIV